MKRSVNYNHRRIRLAQKCYRCLRYGPIEKPFRRVVKTAGMNPKEVVRHTLRHTAITHLVQAGVDLPTVQRISGHKPL